MRAVDLDVDDVVDQVDPRRGQAEGNDCHDHSQGSPRFEVDAGGSRRGEHQGVLYPLTGAARPDQNPQLHHDRDTAGPLATHLPITAPITLPAMTSLG